MSSAVVTVNSSLGATAVREVVFKTVEAAANRLKRPNTMRKSVTQYDAKPIVFNLEIADGTRDTLLRFAKEIFDASAAACLSARVDVVPLFPQQPLVSTCTSSSNVKPQQIKSEEEKAGETLYGPFTRSVMVEEKGFSPQFSYVAMGGTFDHLHGGHKLLLLTSASFATKRLRIGVTSAELLAKKKFAHVLQPFDARKEEVERYMRSVRSDLELEVEEITDMAGGTDKIPGVEALVVSPETLPALAKVNEMRAANGLKPMALVQIPYIGGEDEAHRVSSTKLRQLCVEAAAAGESKDEE